ncbi:DUF4365 domain-containing protein [Kibdelosporangium philippinense]|uniref:DUF4365 domain-containing protein n=1 Tax=Kibdelosporangium philippinense TaxID=211113 RepID=A0ABS8ZQD7_9PSEU|nr:DUF4365 domain-containing protein [Kibdelosporangium philippinense]
MKKQRYRGEGVVSPVGEAELNHQGRYGESYFHALATAAGAVATARKGGDDIEGTDFYVSLPREVRGVRYPKIEVQVKTASAPHLSADGSVWKFRGLDEVQFNDLAGEYQLPHFLVMIAVPSDHGDYACVTDKALELRHVGYWLSLATHQRIVDPSRKRKVTVDIPVDNRLTVESLLSMFDLDSGDVSMPAAQLHSGGTL